RVPVRNFSDLLDALFVRISVLLRQAELVGMQAQPNVTFAERFSEEVWSQRLSSGEQQRDALARALLMRPDWLFLDESTSAVDEKLEAELYAVLARQLPKTTIMSIGHRSAMVKLHQRHLEICPEAIIHIVRYGEGRGARGVTGYKRPVFPHEENSC